MVSISNLSRLRIKRPKNWSLDQWQHYVSSGVNESCREKIVSLRKKYVVASVNEKRIIIKHIKSYKSLLRAKP
jgi:hypothetical protein